MFPSLALVVLALSGGAPKAATNTVCPVLGGKVTPGKSPKVVVRGQEYYLCCAGCDKQLLANPEAYLEKDGSLKRSKKKS